MPALSAFAHLSDVPIPSASLQPLAGLGAACPFLSSSWELTRCSTPAVSQHCRGRQGSLPLNAGQDPVGHLLKFLDSRVFNQNEE